MMEIETKHGVFVTLITLDKWMRQTKTLKGEDLVFFVNKCNRINQFTSIMKTILGVTPTELNKRFSEIDPNFNSETDYYSVRYAPNK